MRTHPTARAPARRLITSGDIRAAFERGERRLQLQPGDLVTPLARDDAQELDIELVGPTGDAGTPAAGPTPRPTGDAGATANGNGNGAADGDLEARVRRILAAALGSATPTPPARTARPVRVEGRSAPLAPFPFPGPAPEMDCRLVDVITAEEHGARLAAGFMSLREGSFEWTLGYDEVDYVIEGELHIGLADGRALVGRPGDVLFIPAGSTITFATPSWTKFFYVTYPADWAGGGP